MSNEKKKDDDNMSCKQAPAKRKERMYSTPEPMEKRWKYTITYSSSSSNDSK